VAALLGFILGLVARVWLSTLRVQVVADPSLARVADRPWVLAFFHGRLWPLLAWRRRGPTAVLVSWSRDGSILTQVLRLLGMSVVRGSSSRGGARGLAAIVRVMKRDHVDSAFAVDGPRGPHGVVKPGAVLAARAAGGVLVPMGSAVARGYIFRNAWDRFTLAWPFTRVIVTLGAPIEPGGESAHAQLEAEVRRANATAEEVLS
jgi:lysophospholipid acyltransferase (LPLAT)-like uncharacterized protein